jgi:FtsZ-binding cell division protein ZapB
MKRCVGCGENKQEYFSKSQWKKSEGKCQRCVLCSPQSAPLPAHLPQLVNQQLLLPQIQSEEQNHGIPIQTLNVGINVELIPAYQMLRSENNMLKFQLGRYQENEKNYLLKISEYADMIPQLHSEIERLRTENDQLRAEIQKINSKLENLAESNERLLESNTKLTEAYQSMMKSKIRERKLALRKLFDDVKPNIDSLSPSSKALMTSKPLKTEVNSAAHNFSKDLIRDAIEAESNQKKKTCYQEMFRVAYNESAEFSDDDDDDDGDDF